MTMPRPGGRVRGSASGRPIMALLDLLGRRMSLRILWELRESRMTFRALIEAAGTNPSVLNARLRELRELDIVDHDEAGYGLTRAGADLLARLLPLNEWAQRWARRVRG
jgi:DNA-binding HxlR family transcriptional regulator